jgi:cytochrome c peroxidase
VRIRFPVARPALCRAAVWIAASLQATTLAFAQTMPPPPIPPGNPVTADKALLGKALFWDEQLSSTRTMACGTCHQPSSGGSDPRSAHALGGNLHPGSDGAFGTADDRHGSPGVVRNLASGHFDSSALFGLRRQVTPRKAPTVVNAAYPPNVLWDGAADDTFLDPVSGAVVLSTHAALESQALRPFVNEIEMGHVGRTHAEVLQRISSAAPLALSPSVPPALASFIAGKTYPQLFQQAFGSPGVTPARVALALATYQRTLISNQTPLDSTLSSGAGFLTPQEQAGFQVFVNAGCVSCHTLPMLTDDSFRYTGVRPVTDDLGRAVVTNNPNDNGKQKVPGLRNVELRAPHFHDGSAATLMDVVEFYDRGGDFSGPTLDPLMQPLNLTLQEKNNLVAFLKRPLTDTRVQNAQAPFDHPALSAVDPLQPRIFGAPTPGTNGFAPRMVALSPPKIGNPQFTVGVENALGGTPCGLVTSLQSTPGIVFNGATMYLSTSVGFHIRRAGPLNGSGPGAGWTSIVMSLPNDPLLVGTTFYGQWLVRENLPGQRFSASEAFEITYY